MRVERASADAIYLPAPARLRPFPRQARVLFPMSSSQTLTVTNDLAELPRLADELERYCEPLEPTMKDMLALQLALEETVTNVIHHGYRDLDAGAHSFVVEFSAPAPDRVRLVVIDDAPAYDPLARPEVDLDLPLEERPIGGLGVHLVKNLMQHTAYERRDGRNVLTMERELRREG